MGSLIPNSNPNQIEAAHWHRGHPQIGAIYIKIHLLPILDCLEIEIDVMLLQNLVRLVGFPMVRKMGAVGFLLKFVH
jgi:hypothetical protein